MKLWRVINSIQGRFFIILTLLIAVSTNAWSQCTLAASGSINWDNASPPACQGGGNAGSATVIIIPVGTTLTFNDNGDTWTGTRIEVQGTLQINAPGQVTINASIEVKSTGTLRIDSKLDIGTSGGCGYTLIIRSGGVADIVGGAADRLNICGNDIARGGTAGCYPYPAGPTPYCEPTGGFPGPVGFDETGVNGTLPVSLIFFNIHNEQSSSVTATWATATEVNSSYFSLQRSTNGKDFTEIGRVVAAGNSTSKLEYSFVDNQPIIGRSYYRLQEVDIDGTVENFNSQFIDLNGKNGISVSPNPFVGKDELTIALNYATEFTSYATITDVSGHLVQRFSFSSHEFKLPFKSGKGTYLLTVSNNKDNFVIRFVVP